MTQKIETVTGRAIPLLLDDIDTDRIIPARYLRCVTFDGLGEHAFKDDRQQDPDHPFDDPLFAGAGILIAGRNFGCGSSREHAPQALIRWGIRAVVVESAAEIFFGNCTSLGVPVVSAERGDLEKLAAAVNRNQGTEVTVDLVNLRVAFGGDSIPCQIPENARSALVSGRYDFLSQLLEAEDEIRATGDRLPYTQQFA